MKDLSTLVGIMIAIVMLTPSKALGQHEEACSRLEAWTSYFSSTTPDPTDPYGAIMLCDTIGTTDSISLHATYRFINNTILEELEDGWGYGPTWIRLRGETKTGSCHITLWDLSPGQTIYFQKLTAGASELLGVADWEHPSFVCFYRSAIWSYTVPDITTGLGSHGLPSGVRVRTDNLTVSIASDTPETFWVLDTQGRVVVQGTLSSSDVNIQMSASGVYILRTRHGSSRFFVSD